MFVHNYRVAPDRMTRSEPAGGWWELIFMLTAEELEQLLEANCSVKISEDDDDQEEPCQS